MAKREKKEGTEADQATALVDDDKLVKLLIGELNKDAKEKVAWNLATDFDNPTSVTEFISTQSTLLDYIISNRPGGGVPVGKLTEFCGEEASGKSLLCAHLVAECQKRGGLTAYIDTENACNPAFMKQLGVDISKMIYVQPSTIEEVGETIQKIILSIRLKAPDKLCLVIWDSVAGTPSKAELEGEYDLDMNAALSNAKALAKMMRKLTQVWGKERIAMVFTNQLKTKIGVKYGDPMGTPGGKAIPYHASVRVRLNRSVQLQEGRKAEGGSDDSEEMEAKGKGGVYGIHTIAKVIKSRLGPPLRRCEFDITFASGIDDRGSWFECLHTRGEIEKSAGWCYYTSVPSGQVSTWGEDGKKVQGDRGVKFREKGWKEELASNQTLRQKVLADLERHLIVRFDGTPVSDMDVDPESAMDAEALTDA